MTRSLKKGPYVNPKILRKVSRLQHDDKTIINIWDRACTITPEMLGYTFGVHNGKTHIQVRVVENMVGHKFGEFSHTRKVVFHGGKMAKEIERDKAQKDAETMKKAKEQITEKK